MGQQWPLCYMLHCRRRAFSCSVLLCLSVSQDPACFQACLRGLPSAASPCNHGTLQCLRMDNCTPGLFVPGRCEKSTLRLLVERTDCDIRSCLNTLQVGTMCLKLNDGVVWAYRGSVLLVGLSMRVCHRSLPWASIQQCYSDRWYSIRLIRRRARVFAPFPAPPHLQFLAKKQSVVRQADLAGLGVGQKDMTKGAFQVWTELLQKKVRTKCGTSKCGMSGCLGYGGGMRRCRSGRSCCRRDS